MSYLIHAPSDCWSGYPVLLALPVSCTEPHVVELDTPIHTPHKYTHTPSIITCTYQIPVPTRPLYLPNPCTYQTPVPTRPLYLPDPCTYQTPVPTRPLYLPDPYTYQTPVPTRPLYLPDPCTYQTPVPTRPLYLPDPCTYQTPVPTRPLYLPDPCTYQIPVLDGTLYLLQAYYLWQSEQLLLRRCHWIWQQIHPIHVSVYPTL